jgi:hypothetical protein
MLFDYNFINFSVQKAIGFILSYVLGGKLNIILKPQIRFVLFFKILSA